LAGPLSHKGRLGRLHALVHRGQQLGVERTGVDLLAQER
jgi:hypothetical protein